MDKNIYLVGIMGSGKSTTGKYLARELQREFVDSDSEIEARTGVGISVIFDIEGEGGFRRRECAVIAELCERNGIVVATGGGAVLDRDNRRLLNTTGFVVYLDAPLELVRQRVERGSKRPLLNDVENEGELDEKLRRLMRERDPIYREIADLVVQPDCNGAASLARNITAALPPQVKRQKQREQKEQREQPGN